MKAAVIYKEKDVRVEHLPKPKVGSKEVLVRVKACGVCPSDLRFYTGDKKIEKPWILGHEVSGVVEEVGEEVSKVKPGDEVVVCTDIPCGKCEYCIEGRTNLCVNRAITDGGFSEFKLSDENYLYKFSEVSFEEASFTEPLACCLNGILRANVTLGSKVAILGAGPIGLLHLQLAKLRGAPQIFVFDPIDERRDKALELGADGAYKPESKQLNSLIKKLTNGKGVDVVIVAVGSYEAVIQGLSIINKQGTLMLFAGIHPKKEVNLDLNFLHYNEITLTGSSDYPLHLFSKALNLILTKRIIVKPLISHILPLEKIKDGFEIALKREGLKVIIKP